MASLRVGINGLGRIGRLVLRHAIARSSDPEWGGAARTGPSIEIVAANDLASPEQIAYLLGHDSVHGPMRGELGHTDGELRAGPFRLRLSSEPDPKRIAWEGVDIVLECTGAFGRRAELDGHLQSGPAAVILGQPGEADRTIVVGVNDAALTGSERVLSAASCTTNAVAPVLSVLDAAFGVRWALLSTVHAVTAAQRVVDGPARDFRRGRAAGRNIVPTTTGAARAVVQVLPALAGKLDGQAIRVPVTDGSLFEVTCTLGDSPGLDRVLDALRAGSTDPGLSGVVQMRDDALVSSDIVGNTHSSIVDTGACLAAGPLIRVVGWYDNEAGYAARLLDLAAAWASKRGAEA